LYPAAHNDLPEIVPAVTVGLGVGAGLAVGVGVGASVAVGLGVGVVKSIGSLPTLIPPPAPPPKTNLLNEIGIHIPFVVK
jgi:hypothetical protein